MNEKDRIEPIQTVDLDSLSREIERDALRYDKAYTEKDEVKLA